MEKKINGDLMLASQEQLREHTGKIWYSEILCLDFSCILNDLSL